MIDPRSSVRNLLLQARLVLEEAGILEADLDARLLLQHAAELTRIDLIGNPDLVLQPDVFARFASMIERRAAREPVYRIIGARDFYGRSFLLSPETLEPRPDTECLVDAVLDDWRDKPGIQILDVGTGSGAIVVSLLCEMPMAIGMATDVQAGALETAENNAKVLGVGDRLNFAEHDYLRGINRHFDVVVSNPPYINFEDFCMLEPEVRLHDPEIALVAKSNGLAAYMAILGQVRDLLTTNGMVYLEVGHDQADAVKQLGLENGLAFERVVRDLNDISRVVVFRHIENQACDS